MSKSFNKSGGKQRKNTGLMIGSIIILVLTVIAFIFVPAISQSASSPDKLVFGKYGNTKIEYVPGNYFARQIEYINNVYRDNEALADNIEYKRQLVWQTAFNQTVIQKAIEEELTNSGVTISDKQINRAISKDPRFMVDGVFNNELYKNTSSSTKFNLRKEYREELLKERYISDVLYSSIRSDNLIDFIYDLGSEEKSFNFAVFNSDNIEDVFFTSYASDNSRLFRKASLNKITIRSSEEAAKKLHNRILTEDITFKDAAIAESEDSFALDGGNAGDLYYFEVLSDIESEESAESIFNLRDRELSDVFQTTYGWVFFEMINSPIDADLNNDEILKDVKIYMSRNEKGLIEDYLVSKGSSFISAIGGESFLSTAISMGLENGTTEYFAVNYGNNRMIPSNMTTATAQNPVFSSASYDELFLEKLFSLDAEGQISDPIVLGSNIVVAQLVGTQKSTKIPESSAEYIKYQIENEISSYMQSDLQDIILNSEKFENYFFDTFAGIFYSN